MNFTMYLYRTFADLYQADSLDFMSYLCSSLCVYLPICCCRLLDILEVIAPYKHFHKLRQFVDLKLPAGFPVKLGEHL